MTAPACSNPTTPPTQPGSYLDRYPAEVLIAVLEILLKRQREARPKGPPSTPASAHP